jgi:hypothetical protein
MAYVATDDIEATAKKAGDLRAGLVPFATRAHNIERRPDVSSLFVPTPPPLGGA